MSHSPTVLFIASLARRFGSPSRPLSTALPQSNKSSNCGKTRLLWKLLTPVYPLRQDQDNDMAKFGEGDGALAFASLKLSWPPALTPYFAIAARWIVEDRADGANVNNWHWTEKDVMKPAEDRLTQVQAVTPCHGACSRLRGAGVVVCAPNPVPSS